MYLMFLSDMFVFIDETGADCRNVLRKHGYSARGKQPQNHSLLVRRERESICYCLYVSQGNSRCKSCNRL